MDLGYKDVCFYLMDQLGYEIEQLQALKADVEEMLAKVEEDDRAYNKIIQERCPVDYLQIIHK